MIKIKSAISGVPAHNPADRSVLIPLLFLAACTLYATPLPDAALSRAYTRIAAGLAETQTEAALDLLEVALEFDPASGDAGYLKARLMLDSDSTTSIQTPVALLETALAEERWDLLHPRDAVLLLAQLYDRLRRYETQYRLLLSLPPEQRTVGQWYYLAARSRHFSGNGAAALTLLREGSRLFPGHRGIETLRIRIDGEYRSYRGRAVLDSRRAVPGEELLSELILSGAQPRELLLQRFLELGYETPEVLLQLAALDSESLDAQNSERLEAPDPETTEAPDLDRFLAPAFFGRRENLVTLHRLFAEEERLTELEAYLADKTFTLHEDADGDGYDDTRYRLENGTLVFFASDGDQDGREETQCSLVPGPDGPSPTEISFTLPDGEVTVRYSVYPEVESLESVINSEERYYRFAPAVYRLDVVAASSLPPVVELALPLRINQDALEALAHSQTITRPGISIRKDPSGSVHELSGEKRVLRYSADGATYVERDVDGNGYREIREVYRGTLLEVILLDQDENGLFEYRYYPQQGLEEWDFDQDGRVDLRRTKEDPP